MRELLLIGRCENFSKLRVPASVPSADVELPVLTFTFPDTKLAKKEFPPLAVQIDQSRTRIIIFSRHAS